MGLSRAARRAGSQQARSGTEQSERGGGKDAGVAGIDAVEQ
jgi:hypothetical protein